MLQVAEQAAGGTDRHYQNTLVKYEVAHLVAGLHCQRVPDCLEMRTKTPVVKSNYAGEVHVVRV